MKLSLALTVIVVSALVGGCAVQSNQITTKTPSNVIENSEDPVYKAMMDPNTELGKKYSEIIEAQNQIEKASEQRVQQSASNLEQLKKEKQEILDKIKALEVEKSKYSKDSSKAKSIQTDIDILQIKLNSWYVDIK